jgi:hypothetical protein
VTAIDKLAVVRKLLAKAEGAATEAEAYNAMARRLITEHGIDVAVLAADGNGPADVIGGTRIAMTNPYSPEKARLLGWIASALGVRSVLHHHTPSNIRAVTIFGYESDRARVELLYTSLLLQASSQLSVARPQPTPAQQWEALRYGRPLPSLAAYRRSWLHGYATEVHRRLVAAQEAAVAHRDATTSQAGTGGPSTALVLADRSALVDRAYAEAFPTLGKSRRRTLSGSGMGDGIRAGSRADLGTGTGVAAARRPVLGA